MVIAHAQNDQRAPRRGADHDGCGGADPVPGVAHGRELPGLELVLGELSEVDKRQLEPEGEVGGRIDWTERLAQKRLELGGTAAHLRSAAPSTAPSDTMPSSWRMARCSSTLVAPSERPSARAISRFSMPSANLMINASRRSSGSCCTPARIASSSSRPSTRDSVV